MKLTITLLALIGCSLASADLWSDFKTRFNRKFSTLSEELARKAVFELNAARVAAHNVDYDLGLSTYRLGVNNFTDLTSEEFIQRNGLRMGGARNLRAVADFSAVRESALPATVDWRTKGIVTPIKNQEQCGSCWAFAAVASLEGQHARAAGKLVSLSEQNLVDCSQAEGNNGCEGGLPDQGYQYIIDNKGIDTEASYPYTAEDDQCAYKKKNRGATVKSYTDVTSGDEGALKKAVATIGPISVGIDASNPSFQAYTSGVYNEPECSTTQLDHGVTVVGYGSDNGSDYWLVKNSWGTDWGINGYIKMSRNNNNNCGIATLASYPVV